MKITIAIAALAALSVPSLASANEVTHVKYACDGNKILDVVYTGEIAVMLQDDELVPMKRATSGYPHGFHGVHHVLLHLVRSLLFADPTLTCPFVFREMRSGLRHVT